MALISLRQLLDHAAEHGYGVPAFNINNMEQALAVADAAKVTDSPVIMQASRGARSYAGDIMIRQRETIKACRRTTPRGIHRKKRQRNGRGDRETDTETDR